MLSIYVKSSALGRLVVADYICKYKGMVSIYIHFLRTWKIGRGHRRDAAGGESAMNIYLNLYMNTHVHIHVWCRYIGVEGKHIYTYIYVYKLI